MNGLKTGFGKTSNEVVIDSLPVQGSIPKWLQGSLIRNGPGTFEVGAQHYRHWFDGLAMLHRFSFEKGQVSYANKFLECKALDEARRTGKISYSEFATDPCRDLFKRVMAVFSPKITDSAKVSIARMADQYYALAETPIQVEFDPQTLRSVGVYQYEENLVGQMTTVHPQFDRSQGLIYNLVTRYHAISHYHFHKIKEDGFQRELFASIPVQQPGYIHSFGMTENYLILAEFPLIVNPIDLLLWLKPYIENFKWMPQRKSKFYLVDRRTGGVSHKFETEAFFAFHHVNAFERNGEVVLDIDAYPDADIIQAYYLNRLLDGSRPLPAGNLRRYYLPLQGGSVRSEVLSPTCIELPRFDEDRYQMRADYRFVYGVGVAADHLESFYNQIVKINISDGTTTAWHQPNCYPGEAVFVSAPEAVDEDDGVVLSVVLDADTQRSFLLVLDAHSFTEIGRAEVPHAVLFGYHGAYFKD